MSSTGKVDPSRPLLRCISLDDSSTQPEQHQTPKSAPEYTKEKSWSSMRYSNGKAKSIILAISATLLASIWVFQNEPVSFRPRGQGVARPAVLEVFQVYAPISTKSIEKQEMNQQESYDHEPSSMLSTESCKVLLMEHSFGFSYGKPFIGEYVLPKCKFNKVTINLTVTSKGRQFDRLAIMYFNDTQIWRTSTAEPTINGIRWEYVKDLSTYMALWHYPQKIIFDLGNLVNEVYTGAFNTTLTATFSMLAETGQPADLVWPISARRGPENQGSVFILPAERAINAFKLPRHINKAVASLSASGQADEEFWWANTLQSDIDKFENDTGTLFGFSPFREVQFLIDGMIAGVQWPFPTIFTGGVVPGLWRPIVGIDAFDLRTHEIDISPWLGVLCDGKAHHFEIRIVGISDDGNNNNITKAKRVGNSWYVTGNLFLWLDDDEKSITSGKKPELRTPPNNFQIS